MPSGAEPVESDLVVIGAGAAGLMASCVAHHEVPTLLVTDRGIGTSNSAVAQGGLQLPASDTAAIERFRHDMLRSGGATVDTERLDHFVTAVRPTVELLQAWGLELDLDGAGRPIKRLAGGLSEPRVVTSGDRIGSAILRVLRKRAEHLEVPVATKRQIVDLRHRQGAYVLHDQHGGEIRARAVIVGVGGGAYEFARHAGRPTSNPPNTNTTLYAALRRVGLAEVDRDLYQYQPYGIVEPDGTITGKCVPESVVELGVRVLDRDGTVVAPTDADRRALTAAMFSTMDGDAAETASNGERVLRLTLGRVDPELLRQRYPHLARVFERSRLDNGDVFVVPVLHYQLGGFAVAPDCSTPIPGLFLAGEVTGGLHGHNRLMGNGITEAVVDGFVAGEAAVAYLTSSTDR